MCALVVDLMQTCFDANIRQINYLYTELECCYCVFDLKLLLAERALIQSTFFAKFILKKKMNEKKYIYFALYWINSAFINLIESFNNI